MTIDLAKLDILPGAESKDGFANALSSKTPGGVQLVPAIGSIRRDATVGLPALRRLAVLEDNGSLSAERTKALRRYILGLAIVALTAPPESFLRQGCNLVPDYEKPREFQLVNYDGTRVDLVLSHEESLQFAMDARMAYGIDTSERVRNFDPSIAEKAGEDKPVKVKSAEVVSVDLATKSFKVNVKGAVSEFATTADTVVRKGKEDAAFEAVVIVKAKLDLEVLRAYPNYSEGLQ
jgi:CRISPR-associated protein Csb1